MARSQYRSRRRLRPQPWLTFALLGVFEHPRVVFRGYQENGVAQLRRIFTYLTPIFSATLVKVSISGSCEVRSPGQVK